MNYKGPKELFVGGKSDINLPVFEKERDEIAGKFVRLAEYSGALNADGALTRLPLLTSAQIIAAEHLMYLEESIKETGELPNPNKRFIDLEYRQAQSGFDIGLINPLVGYFGEIWFTNKNSRRRWQ